MPPKTCDPENIAVTSETLESRPKHEGGTPLEQRQQWQPWGTDGAEVAGVGVRLLVVGVAVEAQGIKSSQGRAEKERYGRLRWIGLLGLLQVSSGKAMNRNSIAGAGERNQNSF